MSAKKLIIIMTTTGLMAASGINAEVVTAVNIGGGHQGNLFNDSLSVSDSYTSFGADIFIYPSSSVQIAGHGVYNAYKSIEGLSNFNGGGSIMIIPTEATSPVSLMLLGEVTHRQFGELFSLYDRTAFTGSAAVGYWPAGFIMLKSRISYMAENYENSDYSSSRGIEVVGGFNITAFGSNAFDAEVGFTRRLFEQLPLEEVSSANGRSGQDDNVGTFSTIDYSLRYSRPLGERTGLKITALHRQLYYSEYRSVACYTIDYLSPWAQLWHGSGISAGIKHIFNHQVTLAINGEYINKSFIDAIDYGADETEGYQLNPREDTNLALYAALSKSISVGSGARLVLTTKIGWTENSSSYDLFDYNAFSASISINMKF